MKGKTANKYSEYINDFKYLKNSMYGHFIVSVAQNMNKYICY